MNALDWLIVLVMAYSIVRATIRGFFQEAFSLAGLILGFLCACWFYRGLAPSLRGLIPSPAGAQLLAFLLLLLGILVLSGLLGRLLRNTASLMGFGLADRLLGAVLGFCRGAILCFALLLALAAFRPAAPWMKNSRFAPYSLRASHALSFLMPKELSQRLLNDRNRLKHITPGWIK
jgi:membrane protein required for colicin V production